MYVFGISVPLTCLLWHLICCLIAIAEDLVWARVLLPDAFREPLRAAQFSFSVIGAVIYVVGAAPLFVYAYKYGLSYSQRQRRFLFGMALVFFTWSFPIFIIQLSMVLSKVKWRNPVDDIVFALSLISSAIGGCIAWFGYMHLVSYYIHQFQVVEQHIEQHDRLAPHPMRPVRSAPREDQPDTI
ncbi:hypothetical protein C3747_43g216 [Trypanosoma cruzi]|uniref:Uncharacterized protein n=3 Tax=Trypanosoma cruzi TaxID=5693 RepID=Q4DME3_TRYCC|nr:hypothetical protein, conserved [Trypanosoma cruzi]EAN93687.1 hypothetical protein, conserved [Trypanosoma cruzi]KAF8302752.1 hypothetical protein TcYC6_0044620 [Trypanosoma cruzi]PWV13391.1 hypothetical protein C3747_43g216 [Trypanosoma cruzi]RNC61006.1 hypothetical protein TcCL_ESM01240 [Trypanosoma cruzi]|eukprot:XP_815538.1 hypothetical protein [Trypanosoma cruzi strain CL Brener]